LNLLTLSNRWNPWWVYGTSG